MVEISKDEIISLNTRVRVRHVFKVKSSKIESILINLSKPWYNESINHAFQPKMLVLDR